MTFTLFLLKIIFDLVLQLMTPLFLKRFKQLHYALLWSNLNTAGICKSSRPQLKGLKAFLSQDEMMVGMENSTRTFYIEWEYYDDYVDPVIVDQNKLKYNKYSIVIIFWIILAAFVGFLFLSLNIMSGSGNFPRSKSTKRKSRQNSRSPV